MSGIYAVATLPEHRGTGLASAAVLQVMRDARDAGMTVSALYPAVVRPYRRLGYELGGSFSEHRLNLNAIPSDLGQDLPAVELLDPERDLEGLQACYRASIRHGNGPLEPTDDAWWSRRILRPFGEGSTRGGGARTRRIDRGVRRVPLHGRRGRTPRHRFRTGMPGVFAAHRIARSALLTYFRSFRGAGIWLQWCGPPEDPIALLLPEQDIATPFRYRWMFRVLDRPGALVERGIRRPTPTSLAVDDRSSR